LRSEGGALTNPAAVAQTFTRRISIQATEENVDPVRLCDTCGQVVLTCTESEREVDWDISFFQTTCGNQTRRRERNLDDEIVAQGRVTFAVSDRALDIVSQVGVQLDRDASAEALHQAQAVACVQSEGDFQNQILIAQIRHIRLSGGSCQRDPTVVDALLNFLVQ